MFSCFSKAGSLREHLRRSARHPTTVTIESRVSTLEDLLSCEPYASFLAAFDRLVILKMSVFRMQKKQGNQSHKRHSSQTIFPRE